MSDSKNVGVNMQNIIFFEVLFQIGGKFYVLVGDQGV